LENKVIVNILSVKWTFNYCLVAAKTKKNNPEEWVAMTFCCVLLLKLPMKPTDVYKCPKHLQWHMYLWEYTRYKYVCYLYHRRV
jgi:hypothetical protein